MAECALAHSKIDCGVDERRSIGFYVPEISRLESKKARVQKEAGLVFSTHPVL